MWNYSTFRASHFILDFSCANNVRRMDVPVISKLLLYFFAYFNYVKEQWPRKLVLLLLGFGSMLQWCWTCICEDLLILTSSPVVIDFIQTWLLLKKEIALVWSRRRSYCWSSWNYHCVWRYECPLCLIIWCHSDDLCTIKFCPCISSGRKFWCFDQQEIGVFLFCTHDCLFLQSY